MKIISRAEWGFDGWRNNSAPSSRPRSRIVGLTIHYNGPATGGRNGAAVVRGVHAFHKNGQGWAGIGYHYLITQDGVIYEGRGLDLVGAHAPAFNSSHLGVQFYIGDGEEPSVAAKRSFLDFKAWAEGTLGRPLSVNGHRDGVATSCPGGPLYTWLKAGLPMASPTPPRPADRHTAPLIPVPGARVSATYGQKPKNNTYWQTKGFHTGRDYAAPEGAPVLAVASGTVTVRDDAVLGCISILRGDNGRFYWYCHLKRGSRDPWRGERVSAGQKIAEVGQTGTGANGPHLHLEDASSGTAWGIGLRDPQWPLPPAQARAMQPNPHEEDPLADIATEKRITFNHTSAPDWAITEPVLDVEGPFARIDAVAHIGAPDGNKLSTRWVTLNRKTGHWHRGPVVRHASNLAQHVFKGHTADPEVSLFLDVWTDAGSNEAPSPITITATVDAWRTR